MAQTKIGNAHGLYRVQIGLVSSNGENYGSSASPSAATVLPSYVIKDPKSAEIPAPDRTVIDFTGGDRWRGSYQYGITSMGSFEMKLATVDATFIALAAGSSVDQTTNTRLTIFGENNLRPTVPQMWIALTYRLQSREAGSKGADKFITSVIPRCWVAPKGLTGAPSFQGVGEYTFTVVPTIGEKFPTGLAFGTNQDFEEDEAAVFHIISDNPIHFVGYIASGTTTTLTLPYKPISYTYTSHDSSTMPVQVVVDGVITDATSVTQATGVVVVPTIAEDYVGVMYETLFEET